MGFYVNFEKLASATLFVMLVHHAPVGIGRSSTITRIMDRPCPFCGRRDSDQGWTDLAQSIELFSNGRKKGCAAALLDDGWLELTLHLLTELRQDFGTHIGLSGCIGATDDADLTVAVGRLR
jgi:hypothetical protein